MVDVMVCVLRGSGGNPNRPSALQVSASSTQSKDDVIDDVVDDVVVGRCDPVLVYNSQTLRSITQSQLPTTAPVGLGQ